MPFGSITIDIDTLSTHFKGFGLKNSSYDYHDFQSGMENFLKFLNEFDIKATFFLVGKDLNEEKNASQILKIHSLGHEIASHSMNHIQGFRLFGKNEKEKEILECEEVIEKITGKKPIGFRTPGWNIDSETLDILAENGYLYDSSIFPSYLNPILKFMHYREMSSRPLADRTTLGKMKYMFSNPLPHSLNNGLIELPISTMPGIRIPFFATFLLKTGINIFKQSYSAIKFFQRPIIYEFHLFDFVDFKLPKLASQIPSKSEKGSYIPQSIHTPFKEKWDLFYKAMTVMAKDYNFITAEELAKKYDSKA